MSGEPSRSDAPVEAVAVATGGARVRHGSIEERRRLVAESLQVGNPGNRSKDLPEQADPKHDCQIELKAGDVRLYEHNPRRANNARFAEIKESIRSTGIRNPLAVTRRPGEKHFIVEGGGNTRLLALQQLWEETRDPRFEKLTALFRPWRSEVHVLTAHLIENEQRGEMTFWDKANGVVALKAQFEEEKGRALSLRQLEEELKTVGFSVNTASLAHYLYATTRLRILGDAVPVLSGLDVKTIQPRLNLMKRYAQMHGGTGEAVLYAEVLDPVFRRYADRYRENRSFNASELCQACEDALAQNFGENAARLRMVLDALAQSPQASLETLLETVGPAAQHVQALRTQAVGRAPNRASAVGGANGARDGTVPRATRGAGGPPARPARSDPTVLDRVKASIGRFAQLANVSDCLQVWDAAPFGYYMEAPPTGFDGDVQQRLEHRAWWLLALVSGQLNERVRLLLPETSRWHQLCPSESGGDKGAPGLIEAGLPAAVMLDAAFFDWLLDGHDESATEFWELANLARELRCASPHRVAVSEETNAAARNP